MSVSYPTLGAGLISYPDMSHDLRDNDDGRDNIKPETRINHKDIKELTDNTDSQHSFNSSYIEQHDPFIE